jgi:hypothetical protein
VPGRHYFLNKLVCLYIINYIKNQKEHHKKVLFRDELEHFFKENGIDTENNLFFKDD